jgi:outer membrane protein insertion porin family
LILGRQYLEYFNIMLTYRHERTKLSDIRILEIPGDININLRSFKISFIYDNRNNLFNTTKGFYFELSNELGGTFTEKINGFLRSIGRLKYFFSWNQSTIMGTSLELGWMEAQGGLSAIPLQERFYTGGPNSLRGFRYHRVGPLDQKGIPIGGRFKLVWNVLEVRRTIYKMIGLAIFTDLGNVWSEPKEFHLRDIRFSPGIGLRFDTPIGVARLDLGINMSRRKGEPATQWIFSIGQPF